MADEVRIVSLVLDATDYERSAEAAEKSASALGAANVELARDTELAEAAMRKLAEASTKASESESKVGREVVQSAASWERLRARLDPVIAGQGAYDRAVTAAALAVRRGHATQEEANRVLELARQRYLGVGNAAAAAARAQEEANKAQIKAQQAWQGLRESLDPALASQSRFARVQHETEQAVKAGVATQAQANVVLAQARERFLGATPAAGQFARATDEVDQSLRGVVARIPLIGGFLSGFSGGALAAAAGMALLVTGLGAGIAKAAEAERVQLRLEAVLKATGNAAGISGAEFEDFAQSMERSTLAQGEAVKGAAAVLASSQSVSGDTFKEVIRLAQDYAAVYGGDVVTATQAFAKALEEPERGIALLRRAGIGLSETQQQLIKDFSATGERAKAQGIILDQLRQRIGGAGAAEASGLTGAVDRFSKAWDDMLKGLANSGPMEVAARAMRNLADVVNDAGGENRISPAERDRYRQLFEAQQRGYRFNGVDQDLVRKVDAFRMQAGATGRSIDDADQMLAAASPARTASEVDYLRSKYSELSRELNPLAEQVRQNKLQQDLLTSAWKNGIVEIDEYKAKMGQLREQAELLRSPIDQLLKSQGDARELAGLSPALRARRQAEQQAREALKGQPFDPNGADKVTQAGNNAAAIFNADQGYQFGRSVQQYDMQAAGLEKVAAAYAISTQAAEKAELRLRAEMETRDLNAAATERLYKVLLKEAEARKAVEAAKLLADTARQASEQEVLNAALAKGTAEFEKAKIAVEVARKVQAGYFAEGSKGAEQYAESLTKLAQEQARQGVIRDTRQLQQSNELLAVELQLVGQRPEIIAREVALLKAKQALLNANVDAASEEGKRYLESVRTNELLTRQLEKARQQQELLMEPFRNFIRGMQDALGQFFEDVFDGNVKSWKSAFGTIKNLAKQFAIEMLKLLTIQPIINYVMNGFSAGPAGTGAQGGLGSIFNLFGGGGLGGSGGSSGGIGGIFGNIFGGGGLSPAGTGGGGGGLFGGLGGGGSSILNQSIASLFSGGGAASGYNAGMLFPGESAMQGVSYAGGFLDSLSIGGGLGALGGFASGIMQLTQGGTANTIGGITSLIGAGVSLIPGVGQILGPIISIAGPLLGGLFGKKKPKIPIKQAQLYTGAPGIATSGADTVFQGTDFVHTTPFGVLGYYGTGTNKRFDDPEGDAGTLLRAVADMDRAIAELLTQPEIDKVASALQGRPGVGVEWKKAFDNEGFDIVKDRLDVMLRTLYGNNVASKGLGGIERSNENIEELIDRAGEVIQVANAIKGLGIEMTDAEKAIKDINEQFDELTKKAKEYGFSTADVAKIDAERRKQATAIALDFNKGVADALLGYSDPYALAQKQLVESQDKRRKEAQYLVEQYQKGLIDVLVDINKLEEMFGKERVALQEQYLEQAGAKWKDFLDELTLGPLSGLSNREKWQQADAAFQDVRGRATAAFAANGTLDPKLAGEFQDAARQALQFSRLYNASGPETAALYEQILALTRQFGNIPGFADGGVARGLSWVGERGPELRYFPQPTQILSAERSQALMQSLSGAAANIDIVAALKNVFQGLGGLFKGNNDSLLDELQQLRSIVHAFLETQRATQATNAAAGGTSSGQATGVRRYATRA